MTHVNIHYRLHANDYVRDSRSLIKYAAEMIADLRNFFPDVQIIGMEY